MIAIAAMSRNRVIGVNGQIPWHLSEDMKFFRQTTTGHIVLMGRKTYDSIGKPLPNRENWVITRGPEIPGVKTIASLDAIPAPTEGRELFLIGGAMLYEELLPKCDELFLTLVDREVEGDAFFPPFEEMFAFQESLLQTPDLEVRRYGRSGLY